MGRQRTKQDTVDYVYLECYDQLPTRKTGEHVRHVEEPGGRDMAFAQRVAVCGVKTGGDCETVSEVASYTSSRLAPIRADTH